MIRFATRCLSLVVPTLFVAPAHAQFAVPQGPAYNPPLTTQGYVRPTYTPGYVPPPPPVYAPSGGYPYGYAPDPAGGALNGVANLTTATAQYYQQIGQAQMTQEDLKRSMMDTRRKVFDEMDYEQNRTRQLQQRKAAQDQSDALRKARNNPSPGSIWSGDVLNVLLADVQAIETSCGVRGASIPLDQNILKHINVTDGTTFGSIGLFRDGRPLNWPLPLQDDRFKDLREQIESLSSMAARGIVSGKPAGKEVRDLLTAIAGLKDQVAAATNDQSPSDNIRSMRYANQLKEAAQTLTDPNAANFLSGKWAALGNTAPEAGGEPLAERTQVRAGNRGGRAVLHVALSNDHELRREPPAPHWSTVIR